MSDVACCMDEGNSCTIDWVVCSHVKFTANSTQSEMDMDNAVCSSVSFALLPPLVPSCLLALCKNKSTNVPNGFSIFDRQNPCNKNNHCSIRCTPYLVFKDKSINTTNASSGINLFAHSLTRSSNVKCVSSSSNVKRLP